MEKCTRCGKPLRGVVIVMELSNTDGCYYLGSIPHGHVSQGGFPFGERCAVLEGTDTVLSLSNRIAESYKKTNEDLQRKVL